MGVRRRRDKAKEEVESFMVLVAFEFWGSGRLVC